jgi:hypothetical protein
MTVMHDDATRSVGLPLPTLLSREREQTERAALLIASGL